MKHQHTCHLWTEKIAARHPEDLTAVERRELDAHIASCHVCALVRKQYDALSLRIHAAVANEQEPYQAILPVSLLEYLPTHSTILDNDEVLTANRQQGQKRERATLFQPVGLAFMVFLVLGWMAFLSRPVLYTTTGNPSSVSPQISVTPTQYSVIGKPTLSVDAINAIFQFHHSPLAGKGQIIYDLGIKYHIDPTFILVLSAEESNFGTTYQARQTKSIAELRCIPHYRCVDNTATFNSWDDGIENLYKLIRNLYVDQWKLTTVDAITQSYHFDIYKQKIVGMKLTIDAWHAGKWSYIAPMLT